MYIWLIMMLIRYDTKDLIMDFETTWGKKEERREKRETPPSPPTWIWVMVVCPMERTFSPPLPMIIPTAELGTWGRGGGGKIEKFMKKKEPKSTL